MLPCLSGLLLHLHLVPVPFQHQCHPVLAELLKNRTKTTVMWGHQDADSFDMPLLHIMQQSAITPLSMDFISSFSFSSEITENVTMVLSKQSDQF